MVRSPVLCVGLHYIRRKASWLWPIVVVWQIFAIGFDAFSIPFLPRRVQTHSGFAVSLQTAEGGRSRERLRSGKSKSKARFPPIDDGKVRTLLKVDFGIKGESLYEVD